MAHNDLFEISIHRHGSWDTVRQIWIYEIGIFVIYCQALGLNDDSVCDGDGEVGDDLGGEVDSGDEFGGEGDGGGESGDEGGCADGGKVD